MAKSVRELRSRAWFDNPDRPDLTALYLERYLNWGLSIEELQSGKPIIGIAQTGSDLSPCNRHHVVLEARVRDGIIEAGGIPISFPVHPIQESGKRPTAGLDRNLTFLSLTEVLFGYPIDGVVLTTGCDKTTPALLMGAAAVDLPAISLSVGPMLNGRHDGTRTGSGTIIWEAREKLARGELDYKAFLNLVAKTTPSVGYCNTMGTATTMNALAEVLGMQLPGSATIPAAYRDRAEMAWRTGRRIVEMVDEDLKPSDIMTRRAFLNAVRVSTAIGGSTNAPIHLAAIAKQLGVELKMDDWETHGYDLPLLVNLQPAGQYLAEDFYHAGGVPAVVAEMIKHGLCDGDVLTVTGKTIGENCANAKIALPDVIRTVDAPLSRHAGFKVLKGNLFDSAIMKTSVINDEFRQRYLCDPDDPDAFEVTAVVFDGPEHYHSEIDAPGTVLDEHTVLVMRGAGPIGFPGAAEVVNMLPPAHLLRKGIRGLPCIGDGRQSGTSGSPSILNASPEAAAGGGLALLRTGDKVRVDLKMGRVDVMISEFELGARRKELETSGGFQSPASQTPWQDIQRQHVLQLDEGAGLRGAEEFTSVAKRVGIPRDSH